MTRIQEKMEEVSVQQVDRLLKTWSQNILDQTKEIIASSLGKYPDTVNGANSLAILDDVKDRQSRVITVRYLHRGGLLISRLLNDCHVFFCSV